MGPEPEKGEVPKTSEALASPHERLVMCGVNGCLDTAVLALRYLAGHDRPLGGQEMFNAEHLLQIANEIEQTTKIST